MSELEALIEKVPQINAYVTLLCLHFVEGEQAKVRALLAQLPNLRWLELAVTGYGQPWALQENFPTLKKLKVLSLQVRQIAPVEAAAIGKQHKITLQTFDRDEAAGLFLGAHHREVDDVAD